MGYRDLKDAYSNSTLINVNSVDISKRETDVRSAKSARANINYKMSNKDLQIQFQNKEREQLEERNRLDRIKKNDKAILTNYQFVHNRLRG